MSNFPFGLPSARLRPAKKRQENLQGGFDSGAGRTPARAERPKSGRSCANQRSHRTPKRRARASIFPAMGVHARPGRAVSRDWHRKTSTKISSLLEWTILLPFRFPPQHLTLCTHHALQRPCPPPNLASGVAFQAGFVWFLAPDPPLMGAAFGTRIFLPCRARHSTWLCAASSA